MSRPLGLLKLTRHDDSEMLIPAEMLGVVVTVEGPPDGPDDGAATLSRVGFREPCHWDTVDVLESLGEIAAQYNVLLAQAAALGVH